MVYAWIGHAPFMAVDCIPHGGRVMSSISGAIPIG